MHPPSIEITDWNFHLALALLHRKYQALLMGFRGRSFWTNRSAISPAKGGGTGSVSAPFARLVPPMGGNGDQTPDEPSKSSLHSNLVSHVKLMGKLNPRPKARYFCAEDKELRESVDNPKIAWTNYRCHALLVCILTKIFFG